MHADKIVREGLRAGLTYGWFLRVLSQVYHVETPYNHGNDIMYLIQVSLKIPWSQMDNVSANLHRSVKARGAVNIASTAPTYDPGQSVFPASSVFPAPSQHKPNQTITGLYVATYHSLTNCYFELFFVYFTHHHP